MLLWPGVLLCSLCIVWIWYDYEHRCWFVGAVLDRLSFIGCELVGVELLECLCFVVGDHGYFVV